MADVINLLNGSGIIVASQFKYLYQVENLNEISIASKKELLKDLISTNANLLGLSPESKTYYPLIPTTADEYCSTVPEIVKSIGIETNDLSDEKIVEFNDNLDRLSNTLEKFEDKSFDDLTLKEKVDFFTEMAKSWSDDNDPSKFMTSKEIESLNKTVIKR